MKLLVNPKRAPSSELQKFFAGLKAEWSGSFPTKITCRVETDRDKIDEILFRRHTGSQGGVGHCIRAHKTRPSALSNKAAKTIIAVFAHLSLQQNGRGVANGSNQSKPTSNGLFPCSSATNLHKPLHTFKLL